jgi:CHAT domain-containing protein
LRPLRHIDEECRRISSLYPRSLVLSGDRATKNAFEQLAPSYDVVHFAGHAVSNANRPEFSMLVLTPDKKARDSGYLYSHELPSLHWRTRIVVLSACSTAAGRQSASEGHLGLARSFVAAGVPSVVASLWEVDDVVASTLMVLFHTRLRAGESASSALRGAQLDSLRKGHPAVSRLSVSAFQLYGLSTAGWF